MSKTEKLLHNKADTLATLFNLAAWTVLAISAIAGFFVLPNANDGMGMIWFIALLVNGTIGWMTLRLAEIICLYIKTKTSTDDGWPSGIQTMSYPKMKDDSDKGGLT